MGVKKQALVTGGSGFLGRHLVGELQQSGWHVRLLNRTVDPSLQQDGVEQLAGSILDARDLRQAMHGCTAVFHLAGRVERDRRLEAELRQLHVDGTRLVLEAAAEAGIQRIVYASTSGTIACSRSPQHPANESDPAPTELIRRWPYYATKAEAESVALACAARLGIELICLNPSLLLGPHDLRMSSTGDVWQLLSGRLPGLPSGGVSFVDVRDVAVAAVQAWQRGRPGERYLLGAANVSLAEFFQRIGELAEVKCPRLRIPDLPARWAASLIDPLCRTLGLPSVLDPASVEMSQVFWYLDSSKAREELGFSPRHPDETLQDTIDDLRRRQA